MKAVKYFESFLSEGIVKKQTPDKSRAEFLIKESEKEHRALLEYIEKIGINEDNAMSYLKNCYDIIMEIIRARMLIDGYNASGKGSHEAEVSYLRNLGFNEQDVQFLDQMRFFRNGTIYYGTIIDKEYAEKSLNFVNSILPKLKKLVENAK